MSHRFLVNLTLGLIIVTGSTAVSKAVSAAAPADSRQNKSLLAQPVELDRDPRSEPTTYSGTPRPYLPESVVPYFNQRARWARSRLNLPEAPVIAALERAAATTGVSYDYLWRTAQRESSFNPAAAARTSSARGLFQFIENTWFEMIVRHGDKHGLALEAALITVDRGGRFRIEDDATRRRVLALRNDPVLASMLAGELARENGVRLAGVLGRTADNGELYIAHFLGADNADRLIQTDEREPWRAAADLFPSAASSNRSIFYSRGVARSLAEVLDRLT